MFWRRELMTADYFVNDVLDNALAKGNDDCRQIIFITLKAMSDQNLNLNCIKIDANSNLMTYFLVQFICRCCWKELQNHRAEISELSFL